MEVTTQPVFSVVHHRIVCAWCGKVLVAGPEPTSHGICEPCRDKVLEDLKKVKHFEGKKK